MSVHFFPENPTAGGGTDPGFITLTGDISGSGSGTISAFLPAITTGKTSTKITFNSKGQVTGGTSLTDLDLPAHSHNVTILGDVTGTGTNSSIATSLVPVTTAGSGIKINYDDKGRVLSSEGLTTIDLPIHTHSVTISGDVTGTGTNSNITTSLPIITSPGQAVKVSYTAKGLVYAGTSLSDSDLPAHNHPVTITGDVTGAGTNSNIATTLASITTGKTSTKVTFNDKGLILSGTTLSDTDLPVHTHTLTITGDVTGTGSNSSIATALPTITSANTATKITYTAKGLVTGGTTLSDTDLPPHTHTVNVTGDISGNGLNSSLSLTLPNIAAAGTYPKVTVNAKGQVTSGSSLLATDIPSLDWAKITTGKPTTLSGYGITDALTIAGSGLTATGNTINVIGTAGRIVANADSLDLATVGTEGTYTKVTTDAYGRAISGTTLSASDIPNLDASKITSGYFLNRIDVAGLPAINRGIQFSSLVNNSPVIRWLLYSSFGTEPGANADSNFGIVRYADDGTQLTIPFVINRSTGNISITTTTASTSTTTGALIVAGGIGCQGTLNANILSGLVQLKTYTTGAEPTASASTVGQIWLNTTTGKIRYVASASTIQTITST